MSSLPPEVSQARQRRRRTIRKSEGSKKQLLQGIEDTHLSLDLSNSVQPDNASVDVEASTVPSTVLDSTLQTVASVSTGASCSCNATLV